MRKRKIMNKKEVLILLLISRKDKIIERKAAVELVQTLTTTIKKW